MSTVMKKQSASATNAEKGVKNPSSMKNREPLAPSRKKSKVDGTISQEEGKTQDFSRSMSTKPMEEEVTPCPTSQVVPQAENPSAKESKESDGHKHKAMCDVLNACHKTKFIPIADGLFTSNVYFQPLEVVEVKRSWIDVKMREVFVGGGVMESSEPHVYAMEADDLLRMLYLSEMMNSDHIGVRRVTFEQWALDVFSKVLAEDSHTDYSERGKIAAYAMTHCEPPCLGSGGHIQFFFQKRCIYDFDDVSTNVVMRGENLMGVKTKSTRGKFEYMIEMHVISIPFNDEKAEAENDEIEMKRRLEDLSAF